MFLNCPAYLDQEGSVRCGLPAEVRCRFTMRSTDGLLESAMIRCPVGHCFNGPIGSLALESAGEQDPGAAAVGSRAERNSLVGSRAGRDGGSGSALRELPGAPERKAGRPNTAPAYYLGHPARLWVTVMGPRRSGSGTRHAAPAVTRRCRDPNSPRDARYRAVPSHLADDLGAGTVSPWNQ